MTNVRWDVLLSRVVEIITDVSILISNHASKDSHALMSLHNCQFKIITSIQMSRDVRIRTDEESCLEIMVLTFRLSVLGNFLCSSSFLCSIDRIRDSKTEYRTSSTFETYRSSFPVKNDCNGCENGVTTNVD